MTPLRSWPTILIMTSLGQELRQEREKRGVRLEEIAQATKVSLRFLTALENDRFDLLPGRFFSKAILRSYANYLGLDEKALLARYEALFPPEQPPTRVKESEVSGGRPFPLSLVLLFFVIIIIVATAYFLSRPGGERDQRLSRKPSLRESTLLLPPAAEPLKASELELPAPITQLQLQITFHQKTWIQVYADGVLKLDGIKNPGATFETTANKELLLHLGNAGGIEFILNGQKGKSLGRSGAVVKNIRITLENMKDFVEPPAENSGGEESKPERSRQS